MKSDDSLCTQLPRKRTLQLHVRWRLTHSGRNLWLCPKGGAEITTVRVTTLFQPALYRHPVADHGWAFNVRLSKASVL